MTATEEEVLTFPCEGSTLLGVLHRAATTGTNVSVLIVVGGPQYRVGSHRQFVMNSRALAAAGVPVLRFDYRGMGDSEGPYGGFERVAGDIRAAIDALHDAVGAPGGVVLLGLCDAASACLMYPASDPRVAGLVLINPWARSDKTRAAVVVKRYYGARLLQADFWRKLLRGELDMLGSLKGLVGNLAGAFGRSRTVAAPGFIEQMRAGLLAFGRPVLVVQSGRDLTADEFKSIWQGDPVWRRAMARTNVEVVDLPQADHTFSQRPMVEEFNAICRDWIARQFRRQ